jgi:hypothetical protein
MEFTHGHLEYNELQAVLKELVEVADVVKSNEAGKVFYELTT